MEKEYEDGVLLCVRNRLSEISNAVGVKRKDSDCKNYGSKDMKKASDLGVPSTTSSTSSSSSIAATSIGPQQSTFFNDVLSRNAIGISLTAPGHH